jgi:hypothetical protein
LLCFIFLLYPICTYTYKTTLEHNETKHREAGGEGGRGQKRREQRKEVMEQRQEELRKFFIIKTEHM